MRMCMRCDGYSWDEIERHTDLMIRVHGFTTVHVAAAAPWTYTIGALESWDQPELLVVDIDPVVQQALVLAVVDDYADRGEIIPSTLELLDVELVPVDESHLVGGLVAGWEARYSMAATAGDFVQVVPGPSWFCAECDPPRRLDEPAGPF
jgi:hypothetical protein